ncbi:MAG: PilN domain-containing protein [Patescibacteria group bacterium]
MPETPNSNINLLKNSSDQSPLDRITDWALTYGRYIMIGTEIVVLLAFISRFSLDRKLTDLKEEIGQKQQILLANTSLENEIKNTQNQLSKAKNILTEQEKPIEILTSLYSLLPPDVFLLSVELNHEKLTLRANAGTTLGFSQFLTNMKAGKNLTQVEIGDIKKKPPFGIDFLVSAQIIQPKK